MGAITTLSGQDAIDFGRDWQRQEDQNNWDYTTQNYQPSYYPDSMPFNSFNSTGIAAPIEGNAFAGAGCGIAGICLGDSVEDSADIGAAERVVGKHAMTAATIVGMIVGPGKAKALTGVGSKPVAYSVAMEVTIAKQGIGTRPSHFKDANTQLKTAIANDPEFAKIMSSLGISVPTKLGTSPANWTWHHVPNQPGVLQLIPKVQHQPGSAEQHLLHPGGKGGFYLWGSQY